MLKKTITYTDFNGKSHEETFFFNLNKVELMEMEMEHKGGLQNHIQRIVDADSGKELIQEFKQLILLSYGVKSEDGKRFVKNDEERQKFSETEAFVELFMELSTDESAASEFVNGIIPANLEADIKKLEAQSGAAE